MASRGGEAAAAGRFIGGGTRAGDRRQGGSGTAEGGDSCHAGGGRGGEVKNQPCDTGLATPDTSVPISGDRDKHSLIMSQTKGL